MSGVSYVHAVYVCAYVTYGVFAHWKLGVVVAVWSARNRN